VCRSRRGHPSIARKQPPTNAPALAGARDRSGAHPAAIEVCAELTRDAICLFAHADRLGDAADEHCALEPGGLREASMRVIASRRKYTCAPVYSSCSPVYAAGSLAGSASP
jgi:hypothetical protein